MHQRSEVQGSIPAGYTLLHHHHHHQRSRRRRRRRRKRRTMATACKQMHNLNHVAQQSFTTAEGFTASAFASSGFEVAGMASKELWWMLGAVLFFHSSEFLLALAYHGRRVTVGSFLISGPYLVALGCALVEHTLETRFTPWLKNQPFVSYTGLAMVVAGEVIRKLAVLTANHNFTHDIKVNHREEHQLITHGIYRFVRHPGYLGFFIWSIGTQLLLCNPVCTVCYGIVTWRFFRDRIPYEEYFLRNFFEEDYEDYAQRVPSGLPFIK